jgi:hypothetical protein
LVTVVFLTQPTRRLLEIDYFAHLVAAQLPVLPLAAQGADQGEEELA